MRRPARILAAIAIAMAPGWAFAQPARSQVQAGPSSTLVAQAQAWNEKAARWTGAYQSVYNASGQLLQAVNAGAVQALDFFDRSQAKDGAAWASDWARARRLQLDGFSATVDALDKTPPSLTARLSAASPPLAKMAAGLRQLAVAYPNQFRREIALSTDVISLAERAASGDGAAATTLRSRRFDVTLVLIDGENTLLDISRASMRRGDPGIDIVDASEDDNLAVAALFRAQQKLAAGASPDPNTAADIRRNANAALAAAQRAPTDASTATSEIEADHSLRGTPLGVRMVRELATYKDAGEVEAALAREILSVADLLDGGVSPVSGDISAALSDTNQLVRKRLALDSTRKQILAGQAP